MTAMKTSNTNINTNAANNKKACRRRVMFSQVEIIELPYTIGDGPASGTPVTVEWEAQDRTAFRIDFFEQYRPQRRAKAALRLSSDARSRILLRSGHSWEEITAGAHAAAKLRKERVMSLQEMNVLDQLRSMKSSKRGEPNGIPPLLSNAKVVHARTA